MSQSRSQFSQRNSRAFQVVAFLALLSAIGQVTLGGVVRLTDSGLGCPDWPLCHGQFIPPADTHTLIEYSHRLSASMLGLLIITAAILAWKFHRDDVRVIVSSMISVVLVLIAAILGGITVLTELDSWAVLIHLSVAELLIACVVVSMTCFCANSNNGPEFNRRRVNSLLAIGILSTFILIISGSYMVGHGYGSTCSTWPLCKGSLLPLDSPYLTHMAHRIIAAFVGIIILTVFAALYRINRTNRDLKVGSLVVLGLFAIQIALGAITVWMGFPLHLRIIHLTGATLVWVSVISVASVHYFCNYSELKKHSSSVETTCAPEIIK